MTLSKLSVCFSSRLRNHVRSQTIFGTIKTTGLSTFLFLFHDVCKQLFFLSRGSSFVIALLDGCERFILCPEIIVCAGNNNKQSDLLCDGTKLTLLTKTSLEPNSRNIFISLRTGSESNSNWKNEMKIEFKQLKLLNCQKLFHIECLVLKQDQKMLSIIFNVEATRQTTFNFRSTSFTQNSHVMKCFKFCVHGHEAHSGDRKQSIKNKECFNRSTGDEKLSKLVPCEDL